MEPIQALMQQEKALAAAKFRQELALCNEYSRACGLVLTEDDMESLIEGREKSLQDSGRVELGEGILPKIIRAFADSPFLQQEDYAETLYELQDAFYYAKTESEELLPDEELLQFMVSVYNGRGCGSVEYLTQTAIPMLCRRVREGYLGDGR